MLKYRCGLTVSFKISLFKTKIKVSIAWGIAGEVNAVWVELLKMIDLGDFVYMNPSAKLFQRFGM